MLDTGNVLNSEHLAHYDADYKLVMNVMKGMGYSAVNLGAWDLYSSSKFVQKGCETNIIPMVSANVTTFNKSGKCIQKYLVKQINGIKIGITGVSPQNDALRKPSMQFQITDPLSALREIIPELSQKTDFIVLLSQLRADVTQELVEKFPNLDIALCVDPLLTDLNALKSNKVMSIIDRGKQIGVLSFEKDGKALELKGAERIYLNDDVASDPIIQAIIEDHNRRIKIEKEQKKIALDVNKQKEILQLTPEEFIKQYKAEEEK